MTDPIPTPAPGTAPAGIGRFSLPTDLRFGTGASAELDPAAASLGSRVLVVTDPGVRGIGLVDRVLAPLVERGVVVAIVDGVSPNPRDHECETIARRISNTEAEVVVAIGGGSAIDAAKCAAALATNGGTARSWVATTSLAQDPLPLIAIPTTAGTGSEVTRGAVITDEATHTKFTVKDARMAPRIALVDPDLTHSVPRHVTAATGMDVLTHAIEAYTGRRATPITDALALQAIRLTMSHLSTAVAHGDDATARDGMMMASLLAGMAFGNADVAAVHCLAEALGGRYDTPHGVANAVMLPHVMRFNLVATADRHAEIADAMGIDTRGQTAEAAASEAVQAVAALATEIGIPPFRNLPGAQPADFAALAVSAEANGSTPSNARPIKAADYERILTAAWNDQPATT